MPITRSRRSAAGKARHAAVYRDGWPDGHPDRGPLATGPASLAQALADRGTLWRAAASTGYGRALALSAQALYGIDRIGADTLDDLNTRFLAARARRDHYRFVLKEKSRIRVSLLDADRDFFVSVIRCFVDGVYGHQELARRNVARTLAAKVVDGDFDLDRAREIAQWVFVDNPCRLFKLENPAG